jgi:tetratricopeptide (TPR) repeat protein
LSELGLDWGPLDGEPVPSGLPIKPDQVQVDLGDHARFVALARRNRPYDLRLLERLTTAIAKNPEDADAYEQRGDTYDRLWQWEDAVKDFTEAIRRRPTRSRLYSNRACMYERLFRWEEALADAHKAAELDPNNTFALCLMAWIQATGSAEVRQLERALANMEQVYRIHPHHSWHKTTLGVVYYRLGQFGKAVTTLEENVASHQDGDPAIHYFLAMSYQQLGLTTRARMALNKAIELHHPSKEFAPSFHSRFKAWRAEAEALIGKP